MTPPAESTGGSYLWHTPWKPPGGSYFWGRSYFGPGSYSLGSGFTSALLLAVVALSLPPPTVHHRILSSFLRSRQIMMYVGRETNSDSTMANASHHRVDGLASVVVLIGIVGAQFGCTFADPVAGILVAGIICKAAFDVCAAGGGPGPNTLLKRNGVQSSPSCPPLGPQVGFGLEGGSPPPSLGGDGQLCQLLLSAQPRTNRFVPASSCLPTAFPLVLAFNGNGELGD